MSQQPVFLKILVLVGAGALLVSGASNAHPELSEPPVCSSLGSGHSTAFCKVINRPAQPGVRDIELTLRAAKVPVKVAGYVVATESYDGVYTPPLVETNPGSIIVINLINALPAPSQPGGMMVGHTNIHTHGLLVSPQNETDSRGHGDNILIDLSQGNSFRYSIQVPSSLPAGTLDNPAPIRHPAGLYWYHPHLHGLAKEQVSGGMSGVISIGRGADSLVANQPDGTRDQAATAALLKSTDERYLELKDLQITTTVAPENANGSAAGIWNSDSSPQFCGDVDLTNISDGYYHQLGATGDAAKNLWLFTMNGQRYPRITIKAGRNHLWRIANLSATMTYRLELLDAGKPVTFDVVSVDGVVAGTADSTGSVAGLRRSELLLMPAGRAEILIRNDGANPGPGRDLVLRTAGLSTGPDGDVWPAVNLAQVHLAGTAPRSGVVIRSLLPRPAQALLSGTNPVPAAPAAVSSHTPGAACTRSVLQPGEWRHIVLSQDPMNFFIASEIAKTGGSSSDNIKAAAFPMGGIDWDRDKHICVSLGHTEIWEIDNIAKELHNFHLHQTKFRLARREELQSIGVTSGPVTDPTGIFQSLGIDLAAEGANGVTVWHDTLPVPLGEPANPGKIYIVINFRADQQAGRYVFHCHILEHEDKGMMAGIEVLRTP